ncbi:hypothetical protein QUC32_28955 (plasmid) [Novosphingobium resinovorum]|uniref:hypothetical protein n=1 Tax=Novosphingobium TaxID=165696 RepID=UPI001B3C87F0|nr:MULTISPECIES: hypothetical protein [Novosphingobium]MBF7015703.1 hypothetical protein [Novosphingobium sp. HR1a]WJM29695.1 hypothetical protein QUC32_28955 [Novosphingobium resinovorum]
MSDLLDFAIKAHGGLDRFSKFNFLTARLRQGGALWALKGQEVTLRDANVKVDLHKEWATHWPFSPTTHHSIFTPGKVLIEDDAGRVVEELVDPRPTFAGFELETPWSLPQLGYFAGYAMWNYLTAPFLLARPGVLAVEVDPWSEGGETWRRLRVEFPNAIATHSRIQHYYFDENGLLRRHDYEVEIQGNNSAAHYLTGPVVVDGITLYSNMRIVPNTPDNVPMSEPELVTIELSDYKFD